MFSWEKLLPVQPLALCNGHILRKTNLNTNVARSHGRDSQSAGPDITVTTVSCCDNAVNSSSHMLLFLSFFLAEMLSNHCRLRNEKRKLLLLLPCTVSSFTFRMKSTASAVQFHKWRYNHHTMLFISIFLSR